MSEFVAGQRWINDAEPSLGLGTVLAVEHRTVSLIFHATGDTRTYARDSAPLTRVRFSPGDHITDLLKRKLEILSLDEQDGLITYQVRDPEGQRETLEERDLDTSLKLNKALDRLKSGQVDDNRWYQLRADAWQQLLKNFNNGIRGLTGARTSLIPHQLYIAQEVAGRYAPRVLLADEVGLGKTIEAGMILHQQQMTGHANRVLIIVPEALLHQWLVELLRRFNLFFSIYDEERCQAIEESTDFDNPFMAEQLVLCHLDLFKQNPQRFEQVIEAQWDLFIVDEAHHLEWNEEKASDEYQLVEQLARVSKGLLLLTATPEQFGKQSHFARLRLLDPDRFNDFDSFQQQEQYYQPVADLIDQLNQDQPLTSQQLEQLSHFEHNLDRALLRSGDITSQQKQQIIHHLLDCHGTGRVLFRNTRAAIKGFPERRVIPHPLELPEAYKSVFEQAEQPSTDWLQPQRLKPFRDNWLSHDTRIVWLVEFLTQNPDEKILLITHYADTAIQLSRVLKQQHNIACSVFHEQLSIVERDKRAADFADRETGTQILLCSEIGSEGRNFQFCHHLIMFDLPLNPDLLEQRIGRLDRIGQSQTIRIHAPYFRNTPQQRLFDWFDVALNAFNSTCPAGAQIYLQHQQALLEALDSAHYSEARFAAFIAECKQQHEALNRSMHEGRDRLLEYGSCRHDIAEKLVKRIEYIEQTSQLKAFMSELFDCYGVNIEEHKPGSYIISPAEHMIGQYPGLSDDGMTITFDREVALLHDDMHFFSWDHPMVLNGIDMLLSQELGNSSVGSIKSEQFKPGQLLIQAIYILDVDIPIEHQGNIAAEQLQALPLEFTFTETAQDVSDQFSSTQVNDLDKAIARQVIQLKQKEVSDVLALLRKHIGETASEYLAGHYTNQQIILEKEIDRLEALKTINPQVRNEEIEHFRQRLDALQAAVAQPAIRLDAVRLIITT